MISKPSTRYISYALLILGIYCTPSILKATDKTIKGESYQLEKGKKNYIPVSSRHSNTRVLPPCPPPPPLAGNYAVTQNPDALPGAFFPASASNSLNPPPQTVDLTFIGGDSGTLPQYVGTPPDTMGIALPNQFLVGLNSGFVSFDKQGNRDNVIDFEPQTICNLDGDMSILVDQSDPNLRYVKADDRVYIINLNNDGNGSGLNNGFTIAVSDSGILSPSTKWTTLTVFDNTVLPDANGCPGDQDLFWDYPSLGIDDHAIYTSADMFDVNGNYLTTSLFVIQKSSLLTDGPVNITVFRDVVGFIGQPDLRESGSVITGVTNFDSNPEFGYYIAPDPFLFGKLNLYRVINPGTRTPTLSTAIDINVMATSADPLHGVPWQGNLYGDLGTLESNDDRMMTPIIRNNQLYVVHEIIVDQTGVGTVSGDRYAERWYQLDVTGDTTGNGGGTETVSTVPSLIQGGTWFDNLTPAGQGPLNFTFGSIMVNARGDLVIGATVSGDNLSASCAFAGRLASDPKGSLRVGANTAGNVYALGAGSYTRLLGQGAPAQFGAAVQQRWGDYSMTSLDPEDDMTIWTIQERVFHGLEQVVVAKLLAP